jgi:hypothetical protein
MDYDNELIIDEELEVLDPSKKRIDTPEEATKELERRKRIKEWVKIEQVENLRRNERTTSLLEDIYRKIGDISMGDISRERTDQEMGKGIIPYLGYGLGIAMVGAGIEFIRAYLNGSLDSYF